MEASKWLFYPKLLLYFCLFYSILIYNFYLKASILELPLILLQSNDLFHSNMLQHREYVPYLPQIYHAILYYQDPKIP